MNKQPNTNRAQTVASKCIKTKYYRALGYLALLPLLMISVAASAETPTVEKASKVSPTTIITMDGNKTGTTHTGDVVLGEHFARLALRNVTGDCAVNITVEQGPCTVDNGSAGKECNLRNGHNLALDAMINANQVGECKIKFHATVKPSVGVGDVSSFTATEVWTVKKKQPSIVWQVPAKQEVLTTINDVAKVEVDGAATNQTVTYESTTPDVCSVSGASVTANKAGMCRIKVAAAENADYYVTAAVRSWPITKKPNEITGATLLPEIGFVDEHYEVSASSTSGLTVAIEVTGHCILVGNKVRANNPGAAAGECTVTYSQAGNDIYEAAEPITTSMIIEAMQTITITQAIASEGDFDAVAQTAATASSGLPVQISTNNCSLEGDPEAGYELGSASIKFDAIGTCRVTYSQPGGEINGVVYGPAEPITRAINVKRWEQWIDITKEPPASLQSGLAFEVKAVSKPTDPVNPRPVKINILPNSSCEIIVDEDDRAEILLGEAGSCSIEFTQEGTAFYLPAPKLTRVIVISQVTDGSNISEYWPSNKLFTTGKAAGEVQAIMSPPMLAKNDSVRASDPNVMVVFGTGKYHQNKDLADKSLNTIYGVLDKGEYGITRYASSGSTGKMQLEKREFSEKTFAYGNGLQQRNRKLSGEAIDWANQYGWYADLLENGNAIGERSVFRPFIANKLFVFNTVIPTVGTCSGATQGWTMLIDWASGLAPKFPTYDADMDGDFDGDDIGFVGYYNETAGSELGRGGDSIYDTSGSEARRRNVTFGTAYESVRMGWEEKTPYGVLKRDAN